MHLSHLRTSFKIPSRQKTDSCKRKGSRAAISTSSLLWGRRRPRSCYRGTNRIPGCLYSRSEMLRTCLIACQEVRLYRDGISKLVPS
jgi:hypothetical protein